MPFCLKFVTEKRVTKKTSILDLSRACQDNNLPTKIIQENKHLFSHFLYHNLSSSLHSSVFAPQLKKADIFTIHEKIDITDNKNWSHDQYFPMLSSGCYDQNMGRKAISRRIWWKRFNRFVKSLWFCQARHYYS